MEKFKDMNYPKQYILIENPQTKVFKTLSNPDNYINIEEFLYGVITVIQETVVDNVKYSEIQYDDQKLGWINLTDSIQIFRFKQEVFRFIETDFETKSINKQMNLNRDFPAHFANKLLNIKSEINYNGEWLYGVFVKNKFFGFHPKKNFENIIHCEIRLENEEVKRFELFKNSNMKTPLTEGVKIEDPKIVSFFKNNKIGRLKINQKEFYWISVAGFEDKMKKFKDTTIEKSIEQKYIDDIFYSVYLERQKSKEIVKTVLSAKSYLKSKRNNQSDNIFLDSEDLNNKIQKLEKDLNDEKKEKARLMKDFKLSTRRLEQKSDYSDRLEKQRDKYKARMVEVEDKLKKVLKKLNNNE